MKILQLRKFYPIQGGVEKVIYDLTTGLIARGIECDMLCADAETSSKKIRKQPLSGIGSLIICPTVMAASATKISPLLVFELRKICSHYDIIHIHHPDPMAALALYLSGYKGKTVLHWHSDIIKQSKALKLYLPLQSWLINRADIIVGTTPVYLSHSPFLVNYQHKCTHLPIGIDRFEWNEDNVNKIKDKYQRQIPKTKDSIQSWTSRTV